MCMGEQTMRKLTVILATVLFVFSTATVVSQPSLIARGGWVSGYFPSWSWQSSSKAKIVSMNCFTHILWVCGSPSGSGISWNVNAQAMLSDCVPTMKANGIKSIFQLCCGWSTSMNSMNRVMFIHNLMVVL